MKADVRVRITSEPLTTFTINADEDCGAIADFFGIVRADENGERIGGLEYEAYQPMAEREMEKIIDALLARLPCRAVEVTHRIGFVPVGESSIAVRVAAPHRQEAISFLAEFMNGLKKDVPIWKKTSPSNAPKN